MTIRMECLSCADGSSATSALKISDSCGQQRGFSLWLVAVVLKTQNLSRPAVPLQNGHSEKGAQESWQISNRWRSGWHPDTAVHGVNIK